MEFLLKKNNILKIILLFIFLTLAVWLSVTVTADSFIGERIAEFGYWGIFIASVVSGFNVIVPIPVVAFLPLFVSVGFGFWLSVLIISLGMTLGDVIGYLIGSIGRSFMGENGRNHTIVGHFKNFQKRHRLFPILVLFLYASFIPLPNELLVIPLAFMRYRPLPIFVAIFLGNIIFNILFAFGVTGLVGIF